MTKALLEQERMSDSALVEVPIVAYVIGDSPRVGMFKRRMREIPTYSIAHQHELLYGAETKVVYELSGYELDINALRKKERYGYDIEGKPIEYFGDTPTRVFAKRDNPDILYAVYSFYVRRYSFSRHTGSVFHSDPYDTLFDSDLCDGNEMLAAYLAYTTTPISFDILEHSKEVQKSIVACPNLLPYMRRRLFLKDPLDYCRLQKGGKVTDKMYQCMLGQYKHEWYEDKAVKVAIRQGYYNTHVNELAETLQRLITPYSKSKATSFENKNALEKVKDLISGLSISLKSELAILVEDEELQHLLEHSLKQQYFGEEAKA